MFDVIFSVAALIFLSPVLALIALAVKFHDNGPILFRQVRVGRNGALFDCLKFRSMTPDAEAMLHIVIGQEWGETRKIRRDPRVTRLGRILRLTSLDELPQFVNVLRGDMSLVGPRPVIPDETRLYGRWLADYCSIRPGLTGLWQVSGRNDLPYARRVAMDVWLARNLSLKVYLTLLLRTAPAVISRKGVY